MDKREKQGALGGVVGTILTGWVLPTVAGVGIWAYGASEKEKKWKDVGKGVLIGTGATMGVLILIALVVIRTMPIDSVEYQNAASLLAKNGITVPPQNPAPV